MRPVRLQKNFLRELVNTSLKKYFGQHVLRGIAGNNPSARKSGTRELHRPHSLHYCCCCQWHMIVKIFPTTFLSHKTFIFSLPNSRWKEILFEGNYSFYGKNWNIKRKVTVFGMGAVEHTEIVSCQLSWTPQESFSAADRSALIGVLRNWRQSGFWIMYVAPVQNKLCAELAL